MYIYSAVPGICKKHKYEAKLFLGCVARTAVTINLMLEHDVKCLRQVSVVQE